MAAGESGTPPPLVAIREQVQVMHETMTHMLARLEQLATPAGAEVLLEAVAPLLEQQTAALVVQADCRERLSIIETHLLQAVAVLTPPRPLMPPLVRIKGRWWKPWTWSLRGVVQGCARLRIHIGVCLLLCAVAWSVGRVSAPLPPEGLAFRALDVVLVAHKAELPPAVLTHIGGVYRHYGFQPVEARKGTR